MSGPKGNDSKGLEVDYLITVDSLEFQRLGDSTTRHLIAVSLHVLRNVAGNYKEAGDPVPGPRSIELGSGEAFGADSRDR